MNCKQKPLPITVNFENLSLLDKRLEVNKIDGRGWGLCCFTDKTDEVSTEGLENWKASLLPVTTWMISPEGKVDHQRGQFNAHPRFQNEESTEKESM